MIIALIILLLISINALYVAAEFSAVSVRRSRLMQQAEAGDGLARRLLPVLEDPQRLDRYIAACQIGITLSSLILGAYGQAALTPALVPLFAGLGSMDQALAVSTSAIGVLVFLTAVQMVVGELVPKSLALQFPTAIARYTVVPMQWSLRLLSWFIVVLNGSGIAILRMLGLPVAGHRHIHSPDEIEYLIAESREGGLLAPEEHERLQRALHLAVKPVEEVMVPRVQIAAVDVDTPFAELMSVVAASPYTRVPVYEGTVDDIVGFVHVGDVAAATLTGGPVSLRQIMRPVMEVPEGTTVERVLERLRSEKQRFAVVIDEFGGTAGLATVGDILDEIFGGIADESDAEEELEHEALTDGRLRIAGSMRLEDVQDELGLEWEGDAQTVGGLVMETLGHLPEAGEQLEIMGCRIEVEAMHGRAVKSIIATTGRTAGRT